MVSRCSARPLGLFVLIFVACPLLPAYSPASEAPRVAPAMVQQAGVHGGLCVQIGADDLQLAIDLARTGRYLVQILDTDQAALGAAKNRLSAEGVYGLVSVQAWEDPGRLPYTENLVNLLVVGKNISSDASFGEFLRVICPGGVVLAVADVVPEQRLRDAGLLDIRQLDSGGWMAATVPWPVDMDGWSHPRHSAAGNAASEDRLVGPPRRIRWLAGPWQEISNMVTDDGRNYYGGLWVRDSFNGLRLWQKSLRPGTDETRSDLRPVTGSATPVAGSGYVFVASGEKVLALDGQTGEAVHEFANAGKPRELLFDSGVLIAVSDDGLRAFRVDDAERLWEYTADGTRCVVAGEGTVGLIQGSPRRGEKSQVVAIDKQTGDVRWSRQDLTWADRAFRNVYYRGMLTFEVSSLNDDGPGNAIHILDANDGKVLLDYDFLPGMNHMRQARAMFVDNVLWLLHGGKDKDSQRQPIQVSAVDYLTGETRVTYPAGLAHCFPPVATPNYLLSGELDFTDLRTGDMDANRISKAACGRENGWVPANGLIYLAPKHCVCWPMLRGYVALAPSRPGGNPATQNISAIAFRLTKGAQPPAASGAIPEDEWPCYRHDAWRSGSVAGDGPASLATIWTTNLGDGRAIEGPITHDWDENPFVKGPVTPPVISGGKVFVAMPDAHQVVALTADEGKQVWSFTADGRVDTPPTLHRGMCLFGTKNGTVYCLRARDGQVVWRLRAAPMDEQIVAYGGLESPWPVPGSVLVVDEAAYFAAGRQSFADGGILIFKVDPSSGAVHWVQRLDSVPQEGFYRSSGLEFDNFDLLFRQGDGVAMSRWVFDRDDGQMTVEPWNAFALLNTGNGTSVVPQGFWSYAPRNQSRTKTFSAQRPLVTFRDNQFIGCTEGRQSIYRCEFDEESVKAFDRKWITGWANSSASREEDGVAWRSQRLSQHASWTVEIYDAESGENSIDAIVLAGHQLYLAGSDGRLQIRTLTDGKLLGEREIPAPTWDGLAVANQRLFVTTRDGQVLCLGE